MRFTPLCHYGRILLCVSRLRGSKTSSLSEVNLVMQPPVPSGEQNLALRTLRLRRANCKRKNVRDCVCVCDVVCVGYPRNQGFRQEQDDINTTLITINLYFGKPPREN